MLKITDRLSMEEIEAELARRDFRRFVRKAGKPGGTPFHGSYYGVLDRFAKGKINKLIVTMPPQHGKSFGSSIMLPAYILGLNPDKKIVLACYAQRLAERFNREIQRLMGSDVYKKVFPGIELKSGYGSGGLYHRTAAEFDVAGYEGGVYAVGRGGSLTGNSVDIMIMDDLYKNMTEANSPVIRSSVMEWYTSVVKTRLHDKSSEMIVMTRWHEDDIVGCLEKGERIETLCGNEYSFDPGCWYRLNYEAVKTGCPTQFDARGEGEPLWPEKHGKKSLEEKRRMDLFIFETMYQGNPMAPQGLLYGDNFGTYSVMPCDTLVKGNYTDTADMGKDYLCSVCYEVGRDELIYISDIVYTSEPMELTEEAVARMLKRNRTRIARIESNNGGRGFARNVRKVAPETVVEWFHQGANK